MKMIDNSKEIVSLISETVIEASSSYRPDKIRAYERAIANEKDGAARWALQCLLENGRVAEKRKSPLCDDTGIPHLLLELGPEQAVTGELLGLIDAGVCEGLRRLPGRPMAVKGEGDARLEQSAGMYEDPGMLDSAPLAIRRVDKDALRLTVLMFGGGPAIRGRSYRVFHKHDAQVVKNQIIEWSIEACGQLGCTPCTLTIGIGRSHYEAAHLMLEAQVDGNYDIQTDFEKAITDGVNARGRGTLGLGGATTVLATFAKIGPARASGVRIVCMRPCCCFEPRIACVDLKRWLV